MNSLRTSGEYQWLMIGVCVVCGLGSASSVLPWLAVLVGQVLAVVARADIANVNAVLTACTRAEHSRADDVPVGGDR